MATGSKAEVKFNQNITEFWKSYFPVRNGIKPESFFGPNNGLGRNYTDETLHYMSKARIARTITDKIESYLNDSQYFMIDMTAGIGGNTLDFLSRKNCVAVMSFERDPMRRLMLQRNIMGYNFGDKAIVPNGSNFKDVIPVSGEEDFTNYKGAIFFFDPPWLPESFKGGKDYKSHYILKDMKVGNLTLEGWLKKFNSEIEGSESLNSIVVFRVPPGYQLESLENWIYIIDELGNDGRLITCIPKTQIKTSGTLLPNVINTSVEGIENSRILTSLMMKLKPLDNTLASQYSNFRNSCNALSLKDESKAFKEDKCRIFVKWGFRDPVPNPDPEGTMVINRTALSAVGGAGIKKDEYETLVSTGVLTPVSTQEPKREVRENPSESRFTDKKIPIEQQIIKVKREMSDSKKIETLDKNSPEFVAEFQNYLNWLLSQFIKKKEDVYKLLEGPQMIKWIQAFTHESFDPSRNNNYDLLEIIGDRATEYIFPKIIIEILRKESVEPPDANKITQYKKEYMSETWQTLTGKSLGFKDWIRARDQFKDKWLEDVLESFIGALAENGDSIRGFGYGINLCDKFIRYITTNIKFDKNIGFGDPKTQFVQRFEAAFGGTLQNNVFEKTVIMGSAPNLIYTVKLTELAKNKLEVAGFVIREDRIVAKGQGANLTEAEKDGFYKANQALDKMGFTNEASRKISEERTLNDVKTEEPILFAQYKNKLQREGYDEPITSVEKKNSPKGNIYIVTLKAYSGKDKSNLVLLGRGQDSDQLKAKIKAIREFLDS